MVTIKTAVISAIVSVLVVTVGFTLNYKPTPTQSKPTAGSVSNPDISSPYFSFGGVRFDATHTDVLTQATTTVCSTLTPSATTTLSEGSGIRFVVSSTTASTVGVYKAAFQTGNTTFLFGDNIAAGAQATIVSTTTTNNFVIAPSQWVNVIMSGGTGTFSPTGTCGLVFQEL